jgi:hypothetical protein
MDKMIFLNVGWMSEYSGPGKITGGGKAVAIQGYGHEMLNFKPFAGRMYGTAVTPGYGDIKLEKLRAAKGSDFDSSFGLQSPRLSAGIGTQEFFVVRSHRPRTRAARSKVTHLATA